MNASTSVQDGFNGHTSIVCGVRNEAFLARMNEAGSAEAIDNVDMSDSRAVQASSGSMRLEG